jgi:hypothetical protein
MTMCSMGMRLATRMSRTISRDAWSSLSNMVKGTALRSSQGLPIRHPFRLYGNHVVLCVQGEHFIGPSSLSIAQLSL